MLLSVAEWPICEGGGAAGWASALAWWAEPPSPEPDSRAQSLAKKERSARPYSQQGAMLSIQLVDSKIAESIQICLLCLPPEPLSRSLAAGFLSLHRGTLVDCLLDMGTQLQHALKTVLLTRIIHLSPITVVASQVFCLWKSSKKHSLCCT